MQKENINVKNYLYNPFDKASFSKLKEYEEFTDLSNDVISYIILSYDKNSDIRKEYASRAQQKVEAAKLSGFKFTLGQFKDDVEEILIGENPNTNLAIIRYLYLFGMPELMALDYYTEKMKQILNQQRKGEDEKNSHQVIQFCLEQINILTETIFHGKESINLRKALYQFVEQNKLFKPRPEEIADKLEKNEDPFEGNTPYGKGYTIDEMKFLGDS
jgi:hypothetical protein